MPQQNKRKRGRPLGSAVPPQVCPVRLRQEEIIPFNAGRRTGRSDLVLTGDVPGDLEVISPLLDGVERRYLTECPDRLFVLWFMVGTMVSIIEQTIESARGN